MDTQSLPFPEEEVVPAVVFSPEEGRRILGEFLAKFGVTGLDISELELRPLQLAILAELMGSGDQQSQKALFEAGTGSGKTLIFLIEALKEIANRRSALFVTTQHILVEQAAKLFRRLVTLRNLYIVELSGKVTPARRRVMHANRPHICFITKGTALNDFDYIDWSKVGLVYRDEIEGDQGDDPGVELTAKLLAKQTEQRQAGTNPFVIRGMSATLAANEAKLLALFGNFKPDLVLSTPRQPALLPATVTIPDPAKKSPLKMEMFEIPADPQIRKLAHQLRIEAVRCEEEIDRHFKVPTLFSVRPDEVDYRIPSYLERETLAERIRPLKKRGDEDFPRLISTWAELNRFCTLHNRLTSMGRFAFLELWFYLYVKRHIQPGLYLEEIEGRKAVGDRGKLSAADKRVLGNENLAPLLAEIISETPYALLGQQNDWNSADNDLYSMLERSPLFAGPGYERRKAIVAARNKQLGLNRRISETDWMNSCAARRFFDDAMIFMAQRELPDSPKLDRMLDLLSSHQDDVREGRTFVYTAQTRHADFLSLAIESKTPESGFCPSSVHGGKGAKMEWYRKTGLSGFKEGEFNILCTTVPYAGTGVDVKDAKMAIYLALPDSNPVKLEQSMGRVVGRAKGEAIVYVLTAKGTLEPMRYFAALKKVEARRAGVSKRSRRVG